MSKQPLVKPMRNPAARQSRTRSPATAGSNAIFSSAASAAAGRMRERSSEAVTVAVPRLPTTTAAAALAARSGGLEIRAGGEQHGEHRGDRVAGAGDVAHLTG